MTKDKVFMDMAIKAAENSKCIRRKYGVILLAADGSLICGGYNGKPQESSADHICFREGLPPNAPKENCCIHAETNAILFSDPARRKGGTMYVSGIPCRDCALLIMQTKIGRVVFLIDDDDDQPGRANFRFWAKYGSKVTLFPFSYKNKVFLDLHGAHQVALQQDIQLNHGIKLDPDDLVQVIKRCPKWGDFVYVGDPNAVLLRTLHDNTALDITVASNDQPPVTNWLEPKAEVRVNAVDAEFAARKLNGKKADVVYVDSELPYELLRPQLINWTQLLKDTGWLGGTYNFNVDLVRCLQEVFGHWQEMAHFWFVSKQDLDQNAHYRKFMTSISLLKEP